MWRCSPLFLRRSVLRMTQRTYTVGVVGLVPDAHNAILLLRHRFRVPFAWGLPGGYLEAGETPGAALARELDEEVGLRLQPRPGVLEHELNHRARCISYVVVMDAVGDQVPRLNGSELLEYRFCSADALPEGLQPTHAELLTRYWSTERSPAQNLIVLE